MLYSGRGWLRAWLSLFYSLHTVLFSAGCNVAMGSIVRWWRGKTISSFVLGGTWDNHTILHLHIENECNIVHHNSPKMKSKYYKLVLIISGLAVCSSIKPHFLSWSEIWVLFFLGNWGHVAFKSSGLAGPISVSCTQMVFWWWCTFCTWWCSLMLMWALYLAARWSRSGVG